MESRASALPFLGLGVFASLVFRQRRQARLQCFDAYSVFDLPVQMVVGVESQETQVLFTRLRHELAAHVASCPGGTVVAGLDTEWCRGSTRPQIALLQVAIPAIRVCVLVRVRVHERGSEGAGEAILSPAPALRQLLEDPLLVFGGVGIAQDVRMLHDELGIATGSKSNARASASASGITFVDLAHLARREAQKRDADDVLSSLSHSPGLGTLTQRLLGVSLNKDRRLRCGDWAAPVLSSEQRKYAAFDALAGAAVLAWFHNRRIEHNAVSVRIWLRGLLCCSPPPRQKARAKRKPTATDGRKCNNKVTASDPARALKHAFAARSRPLYDGVRLLSPTGVHLANVGEKKALWYLKRRLAKLESAEGEVTGEDVDVRDSMETLSRLLADGQGASVRLLFEPKGQGHSGTQEVFYLGRRDNKCVVCGAVQATRRAAQAQALNTSPSSAGVDLIRFFVVPHAFRTHFPEAAKAHCHHDILLLCRACFDVASAAVARRRDEVLSTVTSPELAPQVAPMAAAFVVDREEEAAHRAAKALDKLYCGTGAATASARIPVKRRHELVAVLERYFGARTHMHNGTDTSTDRMLLLVRKGLALKPRRRNSAYVPPEKRVVEQLCAGPESCIGAAKASEDGHLCHKDEQRSPLQCFIEGWRQLFVDTLQPRHLPAGWSVRHQRGGRHRVG